jgi:hypothetical protein
MTMTSTATAALETIRRQLHIDDEWTIWGERGFGWIGHRLLQKFFVSTPIESAGMEVYRVWSTVPVVENVTAGEAEVVKALGLFNRFTVGEALVWDAPARRIVCHTGAIVHADTLPWRPGQIADYSILALGASEAKADLLATALRGEVATVGHPDQGLRTHPDEMLGVGEEVFRPAGQEPSTFVEDDFQQVYSTVFGTHFFSAGAGADGIAIEVPFGTDDTTLIQLTNNATHPALGAGLLCTLKVRIPPDVQSGADQLASILNAMECDGHLLSASFGAWCVDSAGGDEFLAHAWFTPNLLRRPMLATDIASISINRAGWVAQVLLGDERGRVQRPAHEIAAARLEEPPTWN